MKRPGVRLPPDPTQAASMGKRAWQDQLSEGNNPFVGGSEAHREWRAAYIRARDASERPLAPPDEVAHVDHEEAEE